MTSTESPVVAIDRFPVDVTPDSANTLHTVRMILTVPTDGVGQLMVWTAPEQRVIDTNFYLDQSDIRSKQVDWTISTDAGPVVVRSAPGCGCGNRLKYWQPFTMMRMGRLR